MTRNEHLQWCKDRAMEYVNEGDLSQAFTSFSVDMSAHSETVDHSALQLGFQLFLNGHLDTVEKMRKWIQEFN